ncbi:MAG: helix-turn-helix transcriptional regulator [Lentimicrobiaceae bacterium]|jgi:transcriptional regulator with XRE-family HTH domain|nr:helix-turn-helix transcriptional regulator [Lentimicrobiaceae bacterium]
MKLGRSLRKLRELKDYSQEYMAGKLGVSQVTYSRIENDKTKLDIARLNEIAEILDVSLVILMDIASRITDLEQLYRYISLGLTDFKGKHEQATETEIKALIAYIHKLEQELLEIKNNFSITHQK